MNLPVNKHLALVKHICRIMGKSVLAYGETAGQIVQALPDSDYKYVYALIYNNKRNELINYLSKFI